AYTFMRVPPALGPSTVECTQTNIHVALGSSKRTMTSSPPQAGSRSSNTRHSDREVVDFFAFFAARFSLIDFCAVFLACFSPLSFACAIKSPSVRIGPPLWPAEAWARRVD